MLDVDRFYVILSQALDSDESQAWLELFPWIYKVQWTFRDEKNVFGGGVFDGSTCCCLGSC